MAFYSVSNTALADELEVINAIYGTETVTLTFTNPNHTSVELRLPGSLYAFLLTFPALYPEQAPSVTGIDSLQLSLEPTVHHGLTCFRIAVLLAHKSGEVCLFDVVEKYGEIGELRRGLGRHTVAERSHTSVVNFDGQMKVLARRVRASLNHSKKTRRLRADQIDILESQLVQCAVCLEPVFKRYAAILSCKQAFCIECLQDGLGSMMAGNGEFKCCGKFIRTPLVEQFGNLDLEEYLAYKHWLSEATSTNPLYCSQKTCSTFIPSYLYRDGLARCMKCTALTCVNCRGRQHVSVCGYEFKKIASMAKVHGWKFCPSCSHLVERTVGCNRMVCTCGTRFCYNCSKKREDCVC